MSEPSNADCARRAEKLLQVYAIAEGRLDELAIRTLAATLLSDLLADLMHYTRCFDLDFQNCIDVADMHFTDELAQEQRS